MSLKKIHRSNLSKLDENGNPIYREDGKVVKGPNYFPPNLKKFFENKGKFLRNKVKKYHNNL